MLRSDLADPVVFASGRNRLLTFPLTVRQGLLDIHILTRLHGPNRSQAVPVIASGYHHCIDVRIFDKLAHIIGRLRLWKTPLGFLYSRCIWIAQSDNLHPGDFRKSSHQFIRSPTATEKRHANFVVNQRMRSLRDPQSQCGHGRSLLDKRSARNPHRATVGYSTVDAKAIGFLTARVFNHFSTFNSFFVVAANESKSMLVHDVFLRNL